MTSPRKDCKLNFIQRSFAAIGKLIGAYPGCCIIASLIFVAGCVSSLYRIELVEDVRYGYTPPNAPSRKELAVYKEYFNYTDLFGMTAVAVARDEGSLLRPEYFNATAKYHQLVTQDFTVFDEMYGNYSYSTFCPQCQPNRVFIEFQNALWEQLRHIENHEDLNPYLKLEYPTSNLYGAAVDISNYFYIISINESALETTGTKIQADLVTFWFYGNKNNFSHYEQIHNKWVVELYKHTNELDDPLIKVFLYADEGLYMESKESASVTLSLFVGGLCMTFLFMTCAVCLSSIYYDQLSWSKLWIIVAAVGSPALAVASTFGLFVWFSYSTNPLMCVTPVLVVAIGVDDGFLLLHSWQRLHNNKYTHSRRMSVVVAQVGPSCLITSVTNAAAFAVGAFTPMPNVQRFCACTSIAIAIDFILQLTLFAPVLAFVGKPNHQDTVEKFLNIKTWFRNSLVNYSKFLMKLTTRIFVCTLLLCSWATNVYSILNMKVNFVPQRTLASDSPILAGNKLFAEAYDWHQAATFIVNRPPKLSNDADFLEMIEKLETMEHSLGSNFTVMWLRDYMSWHETSIDPMALFGISAYDQDQSISYDQLHEFMALDTSAPLKDMVTWRKNGTENIVESFFFYTAYKNMGKWLTRAERVYTLREIINSYPQFNVSMFELDASIYDIVSVLPEITFAAGSVTMICMAAVCFFFLSGFFPLLIATATIGSICVNTVGLLAWWDTDLDPITTVNVILSVGFSVDYTAHTVYHYTSCVSNDRFVRLCTTFQSVSLPLTQAALSTLLCVSLLAFHTVYSFIVFAKTIFIVVTVGWAHGLFILPTVLAMLPACCFNSKSANNAENRSFLEQNIEFQ